MKTANTLKTAKSIGHGLKGRGKSPLLMQGENYETTINQNNKKAICLYFEVRIKQWKITIG